MIADFCSLVKANRGRENRGKEKRINTRKNYGSEVNSIARRGQGGIPLAGSRDSVPCGAWGNAPPVTPLNLLKEKSQAWHLGCRQRSVPAHKLPLPQERNPPATQKINYENVHPKQSRGRPQTSSVLTALWSPPQRRNPLQHKNQLAQTHKAANIIAFCPQGGFSPCKKSPACRTTDGGN